MNALLLAHRQARLGSTRLPAALLPAFDRPMLALAVERLREHGVRDLVVTVDEVLPLVESWFDEQRLGDLAVRFLPVAENDDLEQILARLPMRQPDQVIDGADLGAPMGQCNPGDVTQSTPVESYRRDLLELLRRRRSASEHCWPGTAAMAANVLQDPCSTTRIGGATGSFLGRDCIVDRRARVSRSVLLPGSRVVGDSVLMGCVVMPGAVVGDLRARHAVIGFDQWAAGQIKQRRLQALGEALRAADAMTASRYLASTAASRRRSVEQAIHRRLPWDCSPRMVSCLMRWASGHPADVLCHSLSLR